MKLLADENFPRPVVEALGKQGHDVLWARLACAGWRDADLLDLAETEGRVVLTLDKDFCQIAWQRRQPLQRSGVILFRVHPATPGRLAPLVLSAMRTERPWVGHVSVVVSGGIEMLPAKRT